ncbi:MAG: exosortase/archaeosortase family protein [Chthoniobacterales bacterium]
MNQISKSIPVQRSAPGYFWAAIACLIAATAALLFLPYSYGVGTERYSLAKLFWTTWNGSEDWEHCMFVPIIAAVLIYLRKDALQTTPYKSSLWPIAFVLMGLGLYIIGIKADVFSIGEYSVFFFFLSAFLWLFGLPKFKCILFPLCFLIFAIPIPASDTTIAFPLRMQMTEMATHMLNFIGLPSIQVGSAVISAPDKVLNIAEGAKFAVDIASPCSGMRSLFALMMVSALYAYFSVKPTWKQILLFCCSVPLAIAGNLARILILTFGTLMFGAPFAIGSLEHPTWFHMLAGFAVFFVALGGLIFIGWILQTDWIALVREINQRTKSKATEKASVTKTTSPKDKDVY